MFKSSISAAEKNFISYLPKTGLYYEQNRNYSLNFETKENTTDNKWELISFHAIPSGIKNMPMGPVTMMRNQLLLPGGTKGKYTSKEWAESVEFWQKYAIKDNE